MGRLSEYFDQHRDNLEDAVSIVLAKADATIDTLDKKVRELEQKLRDVAGEKPVDRSQDRDADLTRQNAEDGPVHEDVKKQNKARKQQ